MSYTLVNPYIKGDFNCEFSGSSAIDAASECWSTLSEHFTNNLPKFAFTLQKGGKLYHFNVKEDVDESGLVNFNIKELKNVSSNCESNFKNNLKSAKSQSGGKKKKKKDDDDDSDSDSDEEKLYNRLRYERIKDSSNLIYYWWYYPNMYAYDVYYVPTFTYPLTPYIEVSTIDIYKP